MARHLDIQRLGGGISQSSVGLQHTPFDVHLELLCDCSPYFDNLFKDRVVAPILQDEVYFPHDDPSVFAEVIQWMYQGQLSPDLLSRGQTPFLTQLWVLADRLEIRDLQNATIVLCKEKAETVPFSVFAFSVFAKESIDFVYTHTRPGSPLRRLLADTWAHRGTRQEFTDLKETLPREFIDDVCATLIERAESARRANNLQASQFAGEWYYYVPSAPPLFSKTPNQPSCEPAADVAKRATPAQMSWRKMKSPASRLRKSKAHPLRRRLTLRE